MKKVIHIIADFFWYLLMSPGLSLVLAAYLYCMTFNGKIIYIEALKQLPEDFSDSECEAVLHRLINEQIYPIRKMAPMISFIGWVLLLIIIFVSLFPKLYIN